jgi:DNA repair protein RadA/Sms
VTKDGMVAGPKLLEHTVDGVLYFEGEQFRNLRLLRTVKNRFGSTNEMGIFEMGEAGLMEVTNPSELFLSESRYRNSPGSAIVATMEGNRPILAEIQALVGFSTYASPRRVANGLDMGRLHQIVAVLERRLGLDFSKQDIYMNVAGGLRIHEPAADLAIALALLTGSLQRSMLPKTVVAGEIGLTGEVRSINHYEFRLSEAEKLGFDRIVLPKTTRPPDKLTLHGIQRIEITSLMEGMTQALAPASSPSASQVAGTNESLSYSNKSSGM